MLFKSNIEEVDLRWIEYIILTVLIASIIISGYTILYYSFKLNIYINIVYLLIIYCIAFFSLKQKEIFSLNIKERNTLIDITENVPLVIDKKKIIPDDELIKLQESLEQLMYQKKPYLDNELNLIKLSQLLGTTPHKLSYIINSGYENNFYNFINKYRVEKAKTLLLENEKNKLSILGIAFEAGFNSKTTFNSIFKKFTNETPSEFKRRCTDL